MSVKVKNSKFSISQKHHPTRNLPEDIESEILVTEIKNKISVVTFKPQEPHTLGATQLESEILTKIIIPQPSLNNT